MAIRAECLSGPVIVPDAGCFVLPRGDGSWLFFDEPYQADRLGAYREHARLRPFPVAFQPRKPQVSLIVFVSEACNLRCDYCKVSAMITAEHKKATRPAAIARAILEAAEASGGQIDVIFYGGEPLMEFRAIEAICTEVSARAPEGRVAYSMTTNGTLLNDGMLETMRRHRICVGVSIDGNPDSHDAHRSTAGGRATHERATRNYARMKASGVECGPICVVTDPARLLDTFDHFVEHHGDHTVHLKPLEVHGNEDPAVLRGYFQEYARQQLRLLARCVARFRDGGPRQVESRTLGVVMGVLRPTDENVRSCHTSAAGDCGIGGEILGVEADGGLIPCPNVKKYQRRDPEWIRAISDRAGYCSGCVYQPVCPSFCLAEMDEAYVERFIGGGDGGPVDALCVYNRAVVDGVFRLYREDPLALHRYAHAG